MNLQTIYNIILYKWNQYKFKRLECLFKGKNVKIRPGFKIGHSHNLILHDNIVLGENIFINAHGGVEIGSGTITGPGVMIYAENHIYDTDECLPFASALNFKKVTIGENCWIGARAFICPGVIIGEGCIVAAGSVVTKNTPPYSVVGGNPARVLKYRDVKLYNIAKGKGRYHFDIAPPE